MENQDIYKLFLRFLKEHGAYTAFFIEFKNGYGNRELWKDEYPGIFNKEFVLKKFRDYFDSLISKNNIIQYAFYWGHTKEGHGFWSDLNRDWWDYQTFIKKIYN